MPSPRRAAMEVLELANLSSATLDFASWTASAQDPRIPKIEPHQMDPTILPLLRKPRTCTGTTLLKPCRGEQNLSH